MNPGFPLYMEQMMEALCGELESMGWKTDVHGDCIRGISASRESGLLDAFTHLEIMLIPVNDDPGQAEIHFHWCANPSKTGINVSAFVRRIRKTRFAPLHEFSDKCPCR